ncbi:MAG: MJ1255/VC2487 family glycosyltransferase [Pontibacterium sp.]
MRILYGVQATGNGHITRARSMAPELVARGVEVDFLFSGRAPEKLFNMEVFGDYQTRQGLTFVQNHGRVALWPTVRKNNIFRCLNDARHLDLKDYDLVLTDFEPVSAWAAKLKGVRSVGVAHQYALCYPFVGDSNRMMGAMVRLFAPCDTAIGVHWHHFNKPILPPLITPQVHPISHDLGKVLVYLPLELPEALVVSLNSIPEVSFQVYCAVSEQNVRGNVVLNPFSRDGFQRDLAACDGVLTNCGFGLISEALQSGKRIYSIPTVGQVEQESNGRVLTALGLATVSGGYDRESILAWLSKDAPVAHTYPNVAAALANWVAEGATQPIEALTLELWESVAQA